MKLSHCAAVGLAFVTLVWSQAPKKGGKQAGDDTSNPAYKIAAVSTAADPSVKPAKSAGFVHPD